MVTPERGFPLKPTSATQLRVGDLIAVHAPSGRWGCLQVTDLEPGARKDFWAGVVDWSGEQPPSEENTANAPILDSPLTRIEMFTEGGCLVTGNRPVIANGHASNRGVFDVGTVHRISGWKSRLRAARERADAR